MDLPDRKELASIWSQVPPDYYFRLNWGQKLWHEWKWLVFTHLLTHPEIKPKKILEVGCAAGHLTASLAKLFPKARVVGVDVYREAIAEARHRYPQLTFVKADAHKLPFKANSFDLVVCSETIEHVLHPDQVLHEIARVLAPRGIALIEMDSHSPLFRFLWWVWTTMGKGKVWKEAHLHPFSARELETLITSNGFTVNRKEFSHFGMAVSFLVAKRK